ncbi:NBR1-Ig-like domain-containing protein [Chloroflexota bacterium]
MKNSRITYTILSLLLVVLLITGCSPSGDDETLQEDASATRAYQTVNALLTQAVTLTPAASATTPPLETAIVNQTPTHTPTTAFTLPTVPATTAAPLSTCDSAGPGDPIDVSIPDDTEMQPGQAFTKTWRLVNTGTCTWTTEYKVALFSGDSMGAQASVALTEEVAPGESVEISVDMTAPLDAGEYQGNWKLRNELDEWFGIGAGDGAVFWVRIVVAGSSIATATNTTPQASATSAPATATTTPIQVSGSATLNISDSINLSSNIVNSGADDALFERGGSGRLTLVPVGIAQFGVYGSTQPAYSNCQATALSGSIMTAGQLSQGTFLCYRTNQGLLGWLLISGFNSDSGLVNIQLLTWAIP